MKQPPRTVRCSAFTLVEVTIALGIISFALLAMIGLIPAGLGSLRDSTQQSINAQILQQISSGLTVKSFVNRTDFSAFSSTNLYFDADAQPLATASGARYRAVITAQNPSLPGVVGGDVQSLASSLKRLGISIERMDLPQAAAMSYALQISYR